MSNFLKNLNAIRRAQVIFVISGYPDIKYLLSVNDPNIPSVVILPQLIAKCSLFEQIFGSQNIITIPDGLDIELPLWHWRHWPRKLWPFLKTATKLRTLLLACRNDVRGIVFNDFNAMSSFILIMAMRRRKRPVGRLNLLPFLHVSTCPDTPLADNDKKFRFLLRTLSCLAGTRIVEARYGPHPSSPNARNKESAVGFALPQNVAHLDNPILSWKELTKKYNMLVPQPDKPGILILATPFTNYWPDINQAETYRAVLEHLDKVLEHEVVINIKMHYRDSSRELITKITTKRSINFLDPYIPAELFMQHYSDIYYFLSSAILEPAIGRKISLYPLMVFNTDAERTRFRDTQSAVTESMEEKFLEVHSETTPS